jgi:hypothetical protein
MRITCEQCGNAINSELCNRYCDPEKKQKQMDEIAEWVDEIRNQGSNILF